MNPLTLNVSPAARRLLPVLPMLPIGLAVCLTVTPIASSAAGAQTLREAGQAAAASQAQTKSCVAQAQEWQTECEAEEAAENDGVRERSGLGWTGIGLISAGGALVVSAATVDRWRSCGPMYQRTCQNIERRQGISGGVMLATGLTFLIIDEVRRHPERFPAGATRPARQTAISIGPRAVHVSMLF
jgi:hypothetical protein